MSLQAPRLSAAETARRGDDIYERRVRALVENGNRGRVVAIDVESEAYALTEDALSASQQLLAQVPGAEIWCVRVGQRALHRMGGAAARGRT